MTTRQMQTKIISLEGNIGSGKSTLLAKLEYYFREETNIVFLQEPVQEWETIKDQEGNTMLQKFYADQEKYSFSFQMMAYISRLALLKKTVKENPGAIIITERSLFTDKMVFAKMLFDDNKIEDVNYQIYLKWFDTFADDFPLSGVIYLKTDPTICSQRINLRNRPGEDGIPLDYLTKCDEYHSKMMNNLSYKTAKLILDGNENINDKLYEWIAVIHEFVDGY